MLSNFSIYLSELLHLCFAQEVAPVESDHAQLDVLVAAFDHVHQCLGIIRRYSTFVVKTKASFSLRSALQYFSKKSFTCFALFPSAVAFHSEHAPEGSV